MVPDESPANTDKEPTLATRTISSTDSGAETVIGPYHLLQLIGQGGMGEVWLAEQKQPVRRRVALKVIKAGMDTREVVVRFASERQALALMDHSAIAKVFDAGSTPEGRPYFVMEYVAGIPITSYCDKHALGMRERLELFIRVCEGVQHAHQRAIIHRDLKPSNILIAELDGRPSPKIIDFGVAKATAQRLTDETMLTHVGAIIGTPEYMSPEQADSTGEDIDTRTDVYSLGVVLYELLVGALPLEFGKLPLAELLRKLREQDAPRPSTKLRTPGDQTTTAARNRRSDPPTLSRLVRGDLDAITMKALEKERVQRYATPTELAADIGRYLRHEPVMARPASAVYRARKYIRRHRLGVALAAGLVAALVSFGAAQTLQLRRTISERDRADRERDRASRERDRASRVTQFMTDMFKVSDPSEARGNSITAREILDRASKDVDTGLSKDPELQAQMMHVMGTVYERLGLYSRARQLLERAVEIRSRVLGPENPETLHSKDQLAGILENEGRYPEAEKLYGETLSIARRVLGPEHPETLSLMNGLGDTLFLRGSYADAEKLFRETFDVRRRVLGPEHLDTQRSMDNLALVLENEGNYAEAEKLRRQTLEMARRVLGPEHPETLLTSYNLASTLQSEGHYAESERLLHETLGIQRRVLGPEHPDTLYTMRGLAAILESESHYVDAEKVYRETLDIQRRVLGPMNPDTLHTISMLADDLRIEGHYIESEKILREALENQRRVLGPENPITLSSMNTLGKVFWKERRYAEAETLVREALAIERRVLGPDDPLTANSTSDLGGIALSEGKRDEALSLLREAVDHGLAPNYDLEIDKDPDFRALHGDPRFDDLVAHAKERAVAAQKPK